MKRIIALALTIVTMLSCLFILTSCHGTYSMYEIKNDLSDHGFSTESKKVYEEDDGTIDDQLSNVSVKITISELGDELMTDKDKKNLTFRTNISKNEYTDQVVETNGYEQLLVGTAKNKKDCVVAILFSRRADARKYEKLMKEKLGEDLVDRDRKIVIISNSALALDCAMAHEVLAYKLEKNISKASYDAVGTSDVHELEESKKAVESIYNVSFDGDLRYVFNATKKDEFMFDELVVLMFEKKSDAKALAKAVEAKGLNVKRDGKTVIVGSPATIDLAYEQVHTVS